jgi:hypothetical protein
MAAAESENRTFTHKTIANGTTANGVAMNGTATRITSPTAADIERAIIETVTYVDLFDYPLTAAEIHRYLYHWPVSYEVVSKHLGNDTLVPHRLSHLEGFYTLPGREATVATRLERQQAANQLWPEAHHYGRLIARLPFVRMVAVTGSLAMDNVQKRADIDYLIVTADDHLWVCRAFVIALVRLAARRNIELCPNYFVSERALRFPEQNLYTAHELAQMIPLFGLRIYQRMRQLNNWTQAFLPNADGPPAGRDVTIEAPSFPGRTGEVLLRSPVGKRLERWEMERKINKFRRYHQNWQESDFSPDRCKGHFDNHQQQTLNSYYGRFSQKGVP